MRGGEHATAQACSRRSWTTARAHGRRSFGDVGAHLGPLGAEGEAGVGVVQGELVAAGCAVRRGAVPCRVQAAHRHEERCRSSVSEGMPIIRERGCGDAGVGTTANENALCSKCRFWAWDPGLNDLAGRRREKT